jgi:predicted RNA-binding protein with PUA-like domain
MAKAHWLIKSEPNTYSFDQLVADGHAVWDGVRNFEARNNLRAMKKGDLVLYYHSNEGKAVVGVARVSREAYADATGKNDGKGDWSVVEVEPVKPLARPVTLDELRSHELLAKMMIIRRPRISVVPVTNEEFAAVLDLAKKRPPVAP